LAKKEAELTRAKQTIKRQEQDIHEMRLKLPSGSVEHNHKQHEAKLKETIRKKEEQIQQMRQIQIKLSKGQKNYIRRENKKIRKLKHQKELLWSREDILTETEFETEPELQEVEGRSQVKGNEQKKTQQQRFPLQETQVVETKEKKLFEQQHPLKREESDSKTSLVPKPYTAHANTRRKERNQMSESSRESADLVGEELWMGCGRWKTRKPPVFTR
jgi:hypothetical protein